MNPQRAESNGSCYWYLHGLSAYTFAIKKQKDSTLAKYRSTYFLA
jgi:hypothetical protein